jgi:hypothetical protein
MPLDLPQRYSRARLIRRAVVGLAALLGLLYLFFNVFPPGVKARRPGSTGASSGFDEADVLPDLDCGSLDGAKLTADGAIFLWGWAYDPRTGAPARRVLLIDNGQPLPPVQVFRERPDVAAAKGNPRLLPSGWNLRLPANGREGHKHLFRAFAILADGKLGRLGRLTVGEP